MARQTKHFQARTGQRGIPGDLVELARRFGADDRDRCVLDRKGLQRLIDELRALQRVAMKALDKGGVVVVEAGGALITAYTVDSFDQRRADGR